jgi:hypothetical protein
LTDLTADRTTDVVLGQHFIEVVHERAGDQQVVHGDGGFRHRGVAITEDRRTRNMILRRHTTGVDELCLAATPKGAVHHFVFEDGSVTEGLIDLTGKQLQIEGTLGACLINLTRRGQSCKSLSHRLRMRMKRYDQFPS